MSLFFFSLPLPFSLFFSLSRCILVVFLNVGTLKCARLGSRAVVSGPHSFGPHPSGPNPPGAHFFWFWAPTFLILSYCSFVLFLSIFNCFYFLSFLIFFFFLKFSLVFVVVGIFVFLQKIFKNFSFWCFFKLGERGGRGKPKHQTSFQFGEGGSYTPKTQTSLP